ncbi:hypothetical protein [Frankia sp. R43]|uniref:hypothetical protein n=1 Tax=Frankia sp. R43 TaxID=269536 RepID=UPI0007C72316|nr:hypothetical protein [Frankia sp. R43]
MPPRSAPVQPPGRRRRPEQYRGGTAEFDRQQVGRAHGLQGGHRDGGAHPVDGGGDDDRQLAGSGLDAGRGAAVRCHRSLPS